MCCKYLKRSTIINRIFLIKTFSSPKKIAYGTACCKGGSPNIVLPAYDVSRHVLLMDNVNELSDYERPDQKC